MNISTTIEAPSKINVNEAARKALDGAPDFSTAAKSLLKDAHRKPLLLAALVKPVEWQAAMAAVRAANTSHRMAVWTAPTRADLAEQADRAFVLADAMGDMLLDFPLPGGQPLRSATKEDVTEAAEFYGLRATNMAHKSRWMMKIAAKVPKGETVENMLDNVALIRMKKDTENG